MAPSLLPPPPDIAQLRRDCAGLLQQAVEESLTARQAINRWPAPSGADPSLDAAYQALLHFEADEVQQRGEMFYMDAQLALLSQIAAFLADNRDLPPYMLSAYPVEHRTAVFHEREVLLKPLAQCRDAWQWIRRSVSTALTDIARLLSQKR
ncbi:MAG: hypothetical protein IPK79_10000 [Vampirovibrionales bacterium]|nr:hypothetical protein [Vampirovibrionales bacterium]